MKKLKNAAYFILLLLFISSCSTQNDFVLESLYNFKTTATIDYPYDTISVNDTLWVSAIINGQLVDGETGDTIKINEGNISNNFIVKSWELGEYSYNSGAYEFKFKTVADYTSALGDATMLGFNYNRQDQLWQIKFGIIFKMPGIYSVDTDLLWYQYPSDTEPQYYGGGLASIYADDDSYMYGALFTTIIASNNNQHLYETLTSEKKAKFEAVKIDEFDKYFFIQVVN